MVHHSDDSGQKRRPGQAGKEGKRPFKRDDARPGAKDAGRKPARGDSPVGKGGKDSRTPAKPEKTGRGERIAKYLARAGIHRYLGHARALEQTEHAAEE